MSLSSGHYLKDELDMNSAPQEGRKKYVHWLKMIERKPLYLSEVSLFTQRHICRVFLRWLRTRAASIRNVQSSDARDWTKMSKRRKWGKDAPCSSSRVIDPSCLFTTDEGESETKIRRTEQLKQQQSQYKHFRAELNPQETHGKKTFQQQTEKPQTL